MEIRMTGSISGARDGQSWPKPGETITVPDSEGASLCGSGLAEPVDSRDANVETATKSDKAVTKRGLTTKDA